MIRNDYSDEVWTLRQVGYTRVALETHKLVVAGIDGIYADLIAGGENRPEKSATVLHALCRPNHGNRAWVEHLVDGTELSLCPVFHADHSSAVSSQLADQLRSILRRIADAGQ